MSKYNYQTKSLSLETRTRISNLQQAIWKLQEVAVTLQDNVVTITLGNIIDKIEEEMDSLYGN